MLLIEQSIHGPSTLGVSFSMYASDWRGMLLPPSVGANTEPEHRWPQVIFGPIDEVSISCPNYEDLEGEISYLVNGRIEEVGVRFHSRLRVPSAPSELVVIGEKHDRVKDYYYNAVVDDYLQIVDERRHRSERSNYLFMDLHARAVEYPLPVPEGMKSPWDVGLP